MCNRIINYTQMRTIFFNRLRFRDKIEREKQMREKRKNREKIRVKRGRGRRRGWRKKSMRDDVTRLRVRKKKAK